jgi:hypothetical protein
MKVLLSVFGEIQHTGTLDQEFLKQLPSAKIKGTLSRQNLEKIKIEGQNVIPIQEKAWVIILHDSQGVKFIKYSREKTPKELIKSLRMFSQVSIAITLGDQKTVENELKSKNIQIETRWNPKEIKTSKEKLRKTA